MKTKKNYKPLLAACIGFLVSAVLFSLLFRSYDHRRTEQEKEQASFIAENRLNALQSAFESYGQIARVWAGEVMADPENLDDFEVISQQLYEKNTTIAAIELAEDGVISYVYPKNNDILGFDLFASENDKAAAEEARDTREMTIQGPQSLYQGGNGFILRQPVYVNDSEFWGFAIIVLNQSNLLEEVNLSGLSSEGYAYRFMCGDTFIAGTETLDNIVSASMTSGRRTWKLEVEPEEGWYDSRVHFSHILLAFLLGALTALGIYLLMRLVERNKELEEKKSDLIIQAKALAASEKANRMQAKALEASKKANEMQVEALEASRKANAAQAQALEISRKEAEQNEVKLQASEAANRAKAEFISRISHDIRTPIGAIMNLTQFAREDMDNPEKLKTDLDRIDTSNRFLLSLINDVLDISKVDSGKIDLNPEPYPYEEYTEDIRNILEPMCQEKGLECEIIRTNSDTGVIVADKVRLKQIALNILSNAVKYTPAGGKVKYISRSFNLPDNKVQFGFTVEDNGIGMSEEFQKRMFDDFSQEYDNPNRPQGITGTGLGLSIVKKMVDLMDGTISVESLMGTGTSVTVSIPFPDAVRDEKYKSAMAEMEQQKEETSLIGGHMLVAEDNMINLEIIRRIMSDFGIETDCAQNGEEAVKLFEASEPDSYMAVLMDLQMPVMNGYEATVKIRNLDRSDALTIPIIAMTADAFDEAAKRAKEAGMTEYLTKPIDVSHIREVLTEIANRKKEN